MADNSEFSKPPQEAVTAQDPVKDISIDTKAERGFIRTLWNKIKGTGPADSKTKESWRNPMGKKQAFESGAGMALAAMVLAANASMEPPIPETQAAYQNQRPKSSKPNQEMLEAIRGYPPEHPGRQLVGDLLAERVLEKKKGVTLAEINKVIKLEAHNPGAREQLQAKAAKLKR